MPKTSFQVKGIEFFVEITENPDALDFKAIFPEGSQIKGRDIEAVVSAMSAAVYKALEVKDAEEDTGENSDDDAPNPLPTVACCDCSMKCNCDKYLDGYDFGCFEGVKA